MLKRLIAVILTCVLLWSGAALAEIEFDISVFENDPNYEVEFDEMDDTGTIQFAEDSERTNIFMGTTDDEDDGMLFGVTDIRIAEGFPPSVRLSILYMAEEWAFIDEFIIIAGSNRYTFGVDCEREILDDGSIMEAFVVVLTDESIGLLEDIANSDSLTCSYRLSGDDDVDGDIYFVQDPIGYLYESYVDSGALENDFSLMKTVYSCEIKAM